MRDSLTFSGAISFPGECFPHLKFVKQVLCSRCLVNTSEDGLGAGECAQTRLAIPTPEQSVSMPRLTATVELLLAPSAGPGILTMLKLAKSVVASKSSFDRLLPLSAFGLGSLITTRGRKSGFHGANSPGFICPEIFREVLLSAIAGSLRYHVLHRLL